ncbi:MAG: pyruvate, phosphate dikinase/phosphoenolpyruvate synthase regulator [Nitrosomonas sp.]|nr:pyruvate, phosphate dikinase/phosphoenolpyruvate synthase regulator [Nitrosomonas sp.]
MLSRSVFFLSDRTGITAETLGHSLLSQFDGIEWRKQYVSFLNTPAKVTAISGLIRAAAAEEGQPPLVFSTLLDPQILAAVRQTPCHLFDFFEAHLGILESVLEQSSARTPGRSHGLGRDVSYFHRIAAIQYALNHDDGIDGKLRNDADIILVGVSRSGKTPVCIYLAMQYGVLAANYPFTPEDMATRELPLLLQPLQEKLFGLTLNAGRLHVVREERYPGSRYASIEQCQQEIAWQNELYRRFAIPHIDSSSISIEEISAVILDRTKIERRERG